MGKAVVSKLTLFLLVAVCAWYGKNLDTWGKNTIIRNDVIMYYAYLPATFIFYDLNFDFTRELPPDFEGEIWLQTAPSGKPILRMTMGLAILWAPFFLAAHLLAHLLGESTLGYSWPYSFFIFVAAVFYLFVGLFYLRKVLLRYYTDMIAAITLALVVLASNLMYYVISEPGMSHVFNFSLISTFLYFSIRWTESPGWRYSVTLGLLAGLIVLIRPVNILVLLFPALIGVSGFRGFFQRIYKNWNWIAIAGVCALLVFLPQMLYWKAQTGYFLFNSYMDSGKFFFLQPEVINGLFSFRKGWLIYTPVMIFALTGFFRLRKYAPDLFFPVLVFAVVNSYVVYSWWCWWYGGSFGSRPMIDMYGIMALPLAAFIQQARKSRLAVQVTVAIVFVGIVWLNQFQMNQYRTSLLHWDSMTKEAYFGIFGRKTWPEGYNEMIKAPDYDKALSGEKEYGSE